MSHLLLSVMGAFAQFERDLIRERQREGIALAKLREGAYTGRKHSLTRRRPGTLSSSHRRRIKDGPCRRVRCQPANALQRYRRGREVTAAIRSYETRPGVVRGSAMLSLKGEGRAK